MNHLGDYDVIVIGAGHAGIEAAHAPLLLPRQLTLRPGGVLLEQILQKRFQLFKGEMPHEAEDVVGVEDAIARLRASDSRLALRSVTLTAKEKVCLHPDASGIAVCGTAWI